ncbi:MAG: phytoene dehydrogenase [Polyangiaceae bacterium]
MSGRHYDVIILGRSIGALLAGALLARRDFSVLVLGQGARPATYRFGSSELQRRSASLLGAASPAWRRSLVELAQSQTFRRRAEPLDPMVSVLMPGRRFELAPDLALFEREIDREFPEVRRIVDDLYANLARVNERADRAFAQDAILPPGSFWERRKASSVCDGIPYLEPSSVSPLSDFPQLHPYRGVVEHSVAFASDVAGAPRTLPPFALARLHAALTRGPVAMPGGEDELVQFLLDRISAHGGTISLADRIERIFTQRDAVNAVLVDGDTGRTGCEFVLSDGSGEELAALSQGEGVSAKARREWPRLDPVEGRFVVSIVVRPEGVPTALGPEALLFSQPMGAPADPQRPVVRLQRIVPPIPPNGPPRAEVLLVAETLVSLRGGSLPITQAREATLRTVRQFFPWLERHLVVVDSPHDGLPVWAYEDGVRREVDRLQLQGGILRPEPMRTLFEVSSPSFYRLAAEPVRGPIERTFLVGRTVLPALGQEGELLAAWGAASLITKSDPRREKLRLELWNKVEIG